MLWLMIATGPVGPGQSERFLFAAPTRDPGQAMEYAKQIVNQQRMPVNPGVQYQPHLLDSNDPSTVLLCQQVRPGPLDPAGVVAGQTAPQNRGAPGGPRDGGSGFENMPGEALSGAEDSMFGDQDAACGTVGDVYTNGQEVKRQ